MHQWSGKVARRGWWQFYGNISNIFFYFDINMLICSATHSFSRLRRPSACAQQTGTSKNCRFAERVDPGILYPHLISFRSALSASLIKICNAMLVSWCVLPPIQKPINIIENNIFSPLISNKCYWTRLGSPRNITPSWWCTMKGNPPNPEDCLYIWPSHGIFQRIGPWRIFS